MRIRTRLLSAMTGIPPIYVTLLSEIPILASLGATITSTINGQSTSTLFPQSADTVFTFLVQPSSGIQLLRSTATPTITPSLSPTGNYEVVISNVQSTQSTQTCVSGKVINLAEVELFKNNVQLPASSLVFTLSSTYADSYSAAKCNDGDTTDLCHSGLGDPNPSLTIISAAAFDTVKVFNRLDDCSNRIEGATITSTINGQSTSTLFPQSAITEYTFSVSSESLTYIPCKHT